MAEAQKQGPAGYERDHKLEPYARRTRINEAGDAGRGSEDSITRGVKNLQLAHVAIAQTISAVRPIAMLNSLRPNGTHESKARWRYSHARKCCLAATA